MDGPRKLERRSSNESLMKPADAARKKASPRNPLKELNSSKPLLSRTPPSALPNPRTAAADRSGKISRSQSSHKVASKSNLEDSKQLASRKNSKPSTPDLVQRLKQKTNPSSVNNKSKEKCHFGNGLCRKVVPCAAFTPEKSLSMGFTDNVGFPAPIGGEEKLTGTPTPTTTPPIEPSASPEVPIGTPLVAATSACFAAGHVIAGVHDRRKCRPRGILTVGRNVADGPKVLHQNADSARASFTPPIAEASMHWLSSPSENTDSGVESSLEPSSPDYPADACVNCLISPTEDRDRASKDEFFCTHNTAMRDEDFVDDELWRFSPSNPTMSESPKLRGMLGLTNLGFETTPSSGISVQKTPTTGGSTSPFSMILKRVAKTSKNKLVKHQKKLGGHHYGSALESSTHSGNSSFDCKTNCTASSSKLSAKQGTLPPFKIDSISEILGNVNLSPEPETSETSSQEVLPDQSFQFDCHPQSLSSVEFKHFRKPACYENSSPQKEKQQSLSSFEARISWRDGLISRIFDSSELDFCNWLSDDEVSFNDIQDKNLEANCNLMSQNTNMSSVLEQDQNQLMSKGFGSIEFSYDAEVQKSHPKVLPTVPFLCAESISTEEFELVSSGESDWTLFYKNNLFEV